MEAAAAAAAAVVVYSTRDKYRRLTIIISRRQAGPLAGGSQGKVGYSSSEHQRLDRTGSKSICVEGS